MPKSQKIELESLMKFQLILMSGKMLEKCVKIVVKLNLRERQTPEN